ncbi:hypothetical protein KEM48_010156 [Puccinia striiformis f. sp. tritici PST-130]|nr:hypothetical protein KEM48_010156 [Puccinia striiformis f. sp. tritici PST-130]
MRFDDGEELSESKDKEEFVDQPKVPNGQLDDEDELTLEDIHNLEEKDNEDVYTSLLRCHTLAKVIATKLRKSPNSKAKLVKLCE